MGFWLLPTPRPSTPPRDHCAQQHSITGIDSQQGASFAAMRDFYFFCTFADLWSRNRDLGPRSPRPSIRNASPFRGFVLHGRGFSGVLCEWILKDLALGEARAPYKRVGKVVSSCVKSYLGRVHTADSRIPRSVRSHLHPQAKISFTLTKGVR